MTALDSLISLGLSAMDTFAGETFKFRRVERTANIGDVTTTKDDASGGFKNVRRLTIVYNLALGPIADLKVGETIEARGFRLKIESIVADATSLTIACIDFTA